jgi:hypothetical protein
MFSEISPFDAFSGSVCNRVFKKKKIIQVIFFISFFPFWCLGILLDFLIDAVSEQFGPITFVDSVRLLHSHYSLVVAAVVAVRIAASLYEVYLGLHFQMMKGDAEVGGEMAVGHPAELQLRNAWQLMGQLGPCTSVFVGVRLWEVADVRSQTVIQFHYGGLVSVYSQPML